MQVEQKVKERPILFQPPMVRAIMEGRKTVTRRIVPAKIVHECEGNEPYCFSVYDKYGRQYYDEREGQPLTLADLPQYNRFGKPGDILWVRETWSYRPPIDPEQDWQSYYYKADDSGELTDLGVKWKPSIHMPRTACRLRLLITSILVERLQDITEEDAKREGAPMYVPGHGVITKSDLQSDPGYSNYINYRMGFEDLWKHINGPDSWKRNDWVWRIEFSKL